MTLTIDPTLPFDLYIAPDTNGHYRNYFDVLSRHSRDIESVFLKAPSGLPGVRTVRDYCRSIGQKPRAIHLLFGERYLPMGLCLRLLGHSVTAIFYYAQHRKLSGVKSMVTVATLRVAGASGMRLHSLEHPAAMPLRAFDSVLLDMHDLKSSAADGSAAPPASGRKVCVIAGHISERKMAVEIMQVLASQLRTEPAQIELRLIGRIAPDYLVAVLAAASDLRNAGGIVSVKNERVPDDVLRTELVGADLVFAIYKDHFGSSGMVVNAMALGRPVLFIADGALAGFAAMMPKARQPYCVSDIAPCIDAALVVPGQYCLSNKRRATFLAERSPARFAETFHAALSKSYDPAP